MKRLWATVGLLLIAVSVHAQHPVLTRYVPGTYLVDNNHRVELRNPSAASINLDGYLLVTRDYSVRFPAGLRIPPKGGIVIAKEKAQGVQFHLSGTPDFLVRFHFLEHQGHYVALYSPQGSLLEAVYMSPSRNVPFLPDRDTCITFDGRKIPFNLPPENRADWQFIPIQDSRADGYTKVKGVWQAEGQGSSNGDAVVYGDLVLRYKSGIATVKWLTKQEQGCKVHVVERSLDQQAFRPVGEEVSKGDSRSGHSYAFYEKGLEEGNRYYYRIRGMDRQGREFMSETRELLAEEAKEEFSMEAVGNGKGELRIRFVSRYSQEVRLKLFNENLQELSILFDDYVYANAPALIVVNAELIAGQRYLIMATTENGRFGKEFVAGE